MSREGGREGETERETEREREREREREVGMGRERGEGVTLRAPHHGRLGLSNDEGRSELRYAL